MRHSHQDTHWDDQAHYCSVYSPSAIIQPTIHYQTPPLSMRPSFTLLSLFFIVAGIAWIAATPAQRSTFIATLFGPPPQQPLQPSPLKTVAALPRHRPAAQAQTVPAAKPARSFAAEGVGDACGGPPTLAVTEVQSSHVYTFHNQDGVTSFSDRLPAAAPTQDVSDKYRRREQYFRVNLIHDQAPNAVRLQTRIMAGTQQIFMFLARHLEVDKLRQVYLDLRLLPDNSSFSRYRRQHAPKLDTNTGFYMPAKNEAVVRILPGRDGDDHTLEIVRHETTHLIAAALFGNLPDWLNEGLAEYFERLDIDGQAKIIRPSPYYLKLLRKRLRRGTLPDLQQHLRLSHRQWKREDQALRYAIGWSVVFFLTTEPQGRHLLASLLGAQAAHRCRRFSTADFLEQHHPGGIAALNRNWRRWVAGSEPPAQYF